jgi:hypothetical protein
VGCVSWACPSASLRIKRPTLLPEPRITGYAKAECVAPTALGIGRPCFPALPGGASFCRAYGAPIDESRFSKRLLRPALQSNFSAHAAIHGEETLARAQTGVSVPQKTIHFSKSMRRSSREPGRMKRPTDLPDSSAKTTGGRPWEPCHWGRRLPRLTLMYFGVAVYCGNYAYP